MDQCVSEALMMEDPKIIMDLRQLNTNGKDSFGVFWDKCSEYLSACTSVHERRHGMVTFMAKAISVRDLIEEVEKLCPADIPIPSESWVRLNFCPRNPHAQVAKRYKGRLEAKHMIQKRQFRKSHPDSHYCAAIFRYMRDYAIKYRDMSIFVCIDDKHRIKVGEPDFPVAAVERGWEVIVSLHDTLAVGDHDFCKFSVIPSVILNVDIPSTIEGSWYRGDVYIGLKDAIFEPSSPIQHATELYNCLIPRMENRHILFVYSDGGPDHRLTYLSVQLSLIALFINLDILIAGRTAPSHSWANPVEKIMSIINLGIQCIGIMRERMGEEFETCLRKCNGLKHIRKECSDFKEDVRNSLAPTKELIASVLRRLQLKGKNFQVFSSASDKEIEDFWDVLLTIEASLTRCDTTQVSLKKFHSLQYFISHCCTFNKYSLTIKKCGEKDCSCCSPVKMPLESFSGVHKLPDPVLNEDGHYEPFDTVYGAVTSENDLQIPSVGKVKQRKSLPFNVTQQHVKNVNLVIQCEECEMWRLLLSKRKLSPQSFKKLENIIEDMSYTCGATFEDITMPEGLESVCIKVHNCYDPIEKLYYSCGFEPICIYCGKVEVQVHAENYPQCLDCTSRPAIKQHKRSLRK